jgi:GNAT superfamily N-acetyltransferase
MVSVIDAMDTPDPATAGVTSARIRALTGEDEQAGARLLARGFDLEPGAATLLRDPATRQVLLENSARHELRASIPHGSVQGAFVDDVLAAIAVWHPPGAGTTSLRTTARKAASALRHGPRVAAALPHIATTMLSNAPGAMRLQRARQQAVATASHGAAWHLAMLATAPEHRGQGLARLLLERQLARCDDDGLPAWLETTDPVNPPIYHRFGFQTVAHVEDAAWLPGLWVMRREPAAVT